MEVAIKSLLYVDLTYLELMLRGTNITLTPLPPLP